MLFKAKYLYLKLLLLLFCSGVICQNFEFECFTNKEKADVFPNFASPAHDPITIQVTNRVTHQIMSRIYAIFLREVLGYEYVRLIPTAYISSFDERKQLTLTLDSLLAFIENGEFMLQKPTINLEVWMPVDHRGVPVEVQEAGAVTAPGRFGLYIPNKLIQKNEMFPDKYPYSMFLGNSVVLDRFKMDEDTFNHILDISGVNCANEAECRRQNITFTPQHCVGVANCAIVLSSHFEETSFVVQHINELKLKLRVIWLGGSLKRTIKSLIGLYATEKRYVERRQKFLVLSWSPSEIIDGELEYTSVTMPKCELIASSSSTCCKYELTPLLKYFSKELHYAEYALQSLSTLHFSAEDIRDIIRMYEKYENNITENSRQNDLKVYNNTSAIIDKTNSVATQFEFVMHDPQPYHFYNEIACNWLRANNDTYMAWKPRAKKPVIYIGGIFPITGAFANYQGIEKAAKLALEAINRNANILPKHDLELKTNDGKCLPDVVLKTFINYYMTSETIVGVLGPACSETVEPIAGISKHFRMAVISYSAEGASFADRETYPYFFRTIGENRQYEHVYSELLQQFNWHRVAALTEDGQKYTEYISHMETLLKKNNIELIANKKFPHDLREKEMNRFLLDLKAKSSKIIIADVNDAVADEVMCEAYKLEMTAKQGYVWFLPVWIAKRNSLTDGNGTRNATDFNKKSSCTDSQIMEAMNGHFSLSHAPFANDEDLMQENITVSNWRQNLLHTENATSSDYSGYAYDAVWVYAFALDQLISENTSYLSDLHSASTTERLIEIIKGTDFNGVSGRIRFGETGSRFTVINVLQWIDGTSRLIGHFTPNISADYKQILGGNLFLNISEVKWLTNDGNIPDDGTLNCALASLARALNIECEQASILLSALICLLVIICLSTFSFIFWKRKYDRKIEESNRYMQSIGLNMMSQTLKNANTLDKWEIPKDKIVVNRRLGEGAFGTVYGGEAQISENGWTAVAVKTLKVGSTKEDSLDFLAEAKTMKRFDHKNVVKLLGVCLQTEPLYTIMEFMLYGDLKTFLLARRHLVKEKITEDSDISPKRLTMMALDIARALSYLADQKYVHRDVACRNCLVNAHRVVKLGDFGMARPMFENDYYRFNRTGMLPVRWMSPESLALGKFTPASDVWSYAVFLYEVITFGSFPFQGLTNNEVLEHVKKGNVLKIPDGAKAQLVGLMKACWNQEYKKRPTASEVAEFISNFPRLLTPCLDVPLSSVDITENERNQFQLELLPNGALKNVPIRNDSSDRTKAPNNNNNSQLSGGQTATTNNNDANGNSNNGNGNTTNSLTIPNGIFLNNIRMIESGNDSVPNSSSNAYNPIEPLLRRDSEVSKSNNSLLRYVPMCGFGGKNKQSNLDNSRSISTSML